MTLYDITAPIREEFANWTGDAPYRRTVACEIQEGASVNLSSVSLSLHTGSHADAPFHYDSQGATIERVPLETYWGVAILLDVQGKHLIRIEDIAQGDFRAAPRLLLRTGGWQDRTRFPERIPTLAPDVPNFLGAQGVRLLGLDVPSVDSLDSKDLPLHHALGRNRIAILESLALDSVPQGIYELVALPLPFTGGDGSPIRAVLRSLT